MLKGGIMADEKKPVTVTEVTIFKPDKTHKVYSTEDKTIEAINKDYSFIVVNFANGDMVGHTGNFEATVKAVEIIDKELELITSVCLKTNTVLIITADHGNAEKLINSRTGEKDTKHNPSSVPFIVVDHQFIRTRTLTEITENENLVVGSLCDIAPTVLKLMGITKPVEMTGQDLTPYLQ